MWCQSHDRLAGHSQGFGLRPWMLWHCVVYCVLNFHCCSFFFSYLMLFLYVGFFAYFFPFVDLLPFSGCKASDFAIHQGASRLRALANFNQVCFTRLRSIFEVSRFSEVRSHQPTKLILERLETIQKIDGLVLSHYWQIWYLSVVPSFLPAGRYVVKLWAPPFQDGLKRYLAELPIEGKTGTVGPGAGRLHLVLLGDEVRVTRWTVSLLLPMCWENDLSIQSRFSTNMWTLRLTNRYMIV